MGDAPTSDVSRIPGFHSVRAHYGVRTERYKLIRFHGDIETWEFYDLEADAHEMKNLIEDPAYQTQIGELKAELARLRRLYGDDAPVGHGSE